MLAPPLEQAVRAAGELIGDQTRDQVDGRHGFGLGLAQPGFQHDGDAADETCLADLGAARFPLLGVDLEHRNGDDAGLRRRLAAGKVGRCLTRGRP